MKNVILLLIVFCALSAKFTYAQYRTIEGKAKNAETKKPVEKAIIEIEGWDYRTITNAEGDFKMLIPDTMQHIKFKAFNNIPFFIDEVNDSFYTLKHGRDITDLLLDKTIEELMDIEISTAGKKKEKLKEIPASIVVISRKEIETQGYTTLEEILQSVPGLYMIEQYNWSGMSGVGVRGFFAEGSFSNMVVMVNGSTALREGYINQYILARIGVPIEAIERIEIVRGPMSVMYGNGAFFGAINIITNDYNSEANSSVTAMYGSNNTSKLDARIESVSENSNVVFNFGSYTTNGVDEPYTKMTNNPTVTLGDGTQTSYLKSVGLDDDATTGGQLVQDIKHFSISAKYKNFKFDVGHTRAQKGLLWIAPSPSENGQNVSINGTDARLNYEQEIGKSFKLNGLLSYGIYNSISRYNIQSTLNAGHSNINSTNMFLELNAIYEPNDKFDATLGLVNESVLNASNDVDIPKMGVGNSSWRIKLGDNINDFGAYTQVNYKPLDKMHIVGGLRGTKFGNYTYQRLIDEGTATAKVFEKEYVDKDWHLTGRLAGIFQISQKHIAKLMWGTAIMSPNMRQNVTRMDLTGGERSTLEPAKIETYEFAYNATFGNWLYTSVSVFKNNLMNLIESSGAPDANGNYTVITQNSGKISTNGMEVTLQTKFINRIDIQLSATYQESEIKKEGWETIDLGYSPNFLAYFKASYNISPKFVFAINGNYVDDMKTSWLQQDFDATIGRRYGEDAKSYFVLNANLRANDIFTNGLFFNANITNLTDTQILYATDPSNQWASKGFVGYGRRAMLTVGYKF